MQRRRPERSGAGPSKVGRRKRFTARWQVAFRAIAAALAGICALLPAVPAAAADAWELIHPKMFDWQRAEQRRAVARDLIRRLDLLAAVVPEQPPEERAELIRKIAELQGAAAGESPERRSRLYISRQYQHFRLLELIGELRASLDCVLAAERLAEEMRCWSLASLHLGDQATLSLALSMLRSARLIPKERNMPVVAKGPALWYAEYGRGILEQILVPYLACAAGQPLAEEADACVPALASQPDSAPASGPAPQSPPSRDKAQPEAAESP